MQVVAAAWTAMSPRHDAKEIACCWLANDWDDEVPIQDDDVSNDESDWHRDISAYVAAEDGSGAVFACERGACENGRDDDLGGWEDDDRKSVPFHQLHCWCCWEPLSKEREGNATGWTRGGSPYLMLDL